MSFLHPFSLLPLLLRGIRVVKAIDQVLIHLQLLLFHDGQVIAMIRMHTGAPLLLGVHGIGTDDASFHERRVGQSGSSTDLIFFAVNRSLSSRRCHFGTHKGRGDATFGCLWLSCPSVPRKVLSSIATWVSASS